MSFELCQSIRRILACDEERSLWSKRARTEMMKIREEFSWVQEGDTTVVSRPPGLVWWTFAGDRANTAISQRLAELRGSVAGSDGLSIAADRGAVFQEFGEAIDEIRRAGVDGLSVEIEPAMLEGLKFTSCLPDRVARGILQTRLADQAALTNVLSEPCRHVTLTE